MLLGLPITVFLAIAMITAAPGPTPLDQALAGHIQAIPWDGRNVLPQVVSDVGGGWYGFYLVPAAVGAFLVLRRQWNLIPVFAVIFLLHYALISPKAFMTAYRPSPAFGVEGAGGLESFPSGHAEWAVSFYGILAYQVWHAYGRRHGVLIFGAYTAVVVLTMLSRIELGRHWPLDTVAGAMAGLVAFRLAVLLHQALHNWSAARTAKRARPVSLPETLEAAQPAR